MQFTAIYDNIPVCSRENVCFAMKACKIILLLLVVVIVSFVMCNRCCKGKCCKKDCHVSADNAQSNAASSSTDSASAQVSTDGVKPAE